MSQEITQKLDQLVAGQATMLARMGTLEGRMETLEGRMETLAGKVDLLSQTVALDHRLEMEVIQGLSKTTEALVALLELPRAASG